MKQIKYTFIIPHKNTPLLLQRCLDSIPNRKDIQIIVIDDNSDEKIVDFSNFPGKNKPNVEIYFSKSNGGAGFARNVGLQHAQGKWLLFADADDYYVNDFLDVIDNNISVDNDILYFNVCTNTTQNDRANAIKIINNVYQSYFNNNLNENIIKYYPWAPWNKVFSHHFIKKNNIKFDEIPVGNDAFFSFRAAKAAQSIRIINNKLYCSTYNAHSITYQKTTFKRELSLLEINIRINKFLSENNLDECQILILSPLRIIALIKRYGLIKTLQYLDFIHQQSYLMKAILLWYKILRKKITLISVKYNQTLPD